MVQKIHTTMGRKLTNRDPFSNGTEFTWWEHNNCGKCIKSSEPRDEGTRYTNATEDNMPKCSIQRDIVTRMFCNDPIKEETVRICNAFTMRGELCPYLQTERKKYQKKDKQQTTIEL